MYHLPYGSTVHLQPLFNQTECRTSSQCYWLLSDGFTRINYPFVEKIDSKYSFASNGTLTIRNIQSDDNGIYHFFRLNQSKWIVSKAFLNLHGAPFPSVWAQYWPNVRRFSLCFCSSEILTTVSLGSRRSRCNGR